MLKYFYLLILFILLSECRLHSQTNWNFDDNGNWDASAKWSKGVPAAGISTTINKNVKVTLNTTGNCGLLTINNSGAVLDLSSNTINISGNINLNRASNIFCNKSNVILNGPYLQTITVNDGSTLTFYDLTINNVAGIKLNNNIRVVHKLTILNGEFDVFNSAITFANGVEITCTGGTITASSTKGVVNFEGVVDLVYNTTNSISTGKELPYDNTSLRNLTLNHRVLLLFLNSDITINGNLIFNAGNLNLNEHHITLCPSCSITGETNSNKIYGKGTVSTIRNLDKPDSVNAGNLGIAITSHADLGKTIIIRGHEAQTGTNFTGIKRYYKIIPSNNKELNAILGFYFFESELNNQAKDKLSFFYSTNEGTDWSFMETKSRNLGNNYFRTSELSELSRITMGNYKEIPVPLPLLSFEGIYEEGKISLYWATAPAENGDNILVERSINGRSFNAFNSVNKKCTKNRSEKFSLADDNPPKNSVVYYRLKQSSENGSFKTSDAIAARSNNFSSELIVSPPEHNGDELEVKVKNTGNLIVFVEITNVFNSVYYSQIYATEKNEFTKLNVKLINLNKGEMYFLKVSNGKDNVVKIFVY
ncbi:MAG: hypothetical protein PHD97_02055 [Bacteroidales bacterium]|nr:hypothetical protein [Bacteroidales bacterium]